MTFPSEHDGFLAVVLAGLGAPLEALECEQMTIHQGMEVVSVEHGVVFASAVDEHVAEDLDSHC
jgi:hypothetical protein